MNYFDISTMRVRNSLSLFAFRYWTWRTIQTWDSNIAENINLKENSIIKSFRYLHC